MKGSRICHDYIADVEFSMARSVKLFQRMSLPLKGCFNKGFVITAHARLGKFEKFLATYYSDQVEPKRPMIFIGVRKDSLTIFNIGK